MTAMKTMAGIGTVNVKKIKLHYKTRLSNIKL
jgi:hypothetical protein